MKTANQRLKERWSACLVGSMLLALTVHLVLAWAVPPWDFPLTAPREQTATFVQLIPMAASKEFMDADPNVLPYVSPSVAVQPEIILPETRDDPHLPEWYPAMTPVSAPRIAPRLDAELVSVRPSAGRSSLSEMVAPIAWPEITNPETMTGYIRARYNPILATNGVTGTVVLSLWVDERGLVERVRLNESSGTAVLDEIAVKTFEDIVTFSPARHNLRALAVQFNLSVPFLRAW